MTDSDFRIICISECLFTQSSKCFKKGKDSRTLEKNSKNQNFNETLEKPSIWLQTKCNDNKDREDWGKRMIRNRKRAKLSKPNQIRIPDVSNQHIIISTERHCIGNMLQLPTQWDWIPFLQSTDLISSDDNTPLGVKRWFLEVSPVNSYQ